MIENLKAIKIIEKNDDIKMTSLLNSMKNEHGILEIDVCVFYDGFYEVIGTVRADSFKVYDSRCKGVYFYMKYEQVFNCALSDIKALVNADIEHGPYNLNNENECEKICICKSLKVDFD